MEETKSTPLSREPFDRSRRGRETVDGKGRSELSNQREDFEPLTGTPKLNDVGFRRASARFVDHLG